MQAVRDEPHDSACGRKLGTSETVIVDGDDSTHVAYSGVACHHRRHHHHCVTVGSRHCIIAVGRAKDDGKNRQWRSIVTSKLPVLAGSATKIDFVRRCVGRMLACDAQVRS